MKLTKISIDKIKPAPYNPRIDIKDNPDFYEKLKNSIEKFGYVEPIIYNKRTGHIVGGNQRYQILKDKGIKEIEVVEIDLPEEDEKALNIALNKISGDWDFPKLNELILDLEEQDYDIELTGFDVDELNDIFDDLKEAEEDDFDVEDAITEEPKSKYGDIYQLGRHRLMCGDATKEEDVRALMDGKKAHSVLTDPPYSFNKNMKNDDLDEKQLTELNKKFVSNIVSVNNSTMICFHGTRPFPTMLDATKNTDWKFKRMLWLSKPNDITFPWRGWILKSEAILVFQKGKGNYNEIKPYAHDTYVFNHPGNYNKTIEREGIHPLAHPSIKPLPVIVDLMKRISKPEQIIFDPFGGSGTTLIAAEQLNRICYMMEIDPVYVDVIIKRWEELTGKQAEYLGNISQN